MVDWFYHMSTLVGLFNAEDGIVYKENKKQIWFQMTNNVTYWPSTQPSIKKQVHPVEDIKI